MIDAGTESAGTVVEVVVSLAKDADEDTGCVRLLVASGLFCAQRQCLELPNNKNPTANL